MVPLVYYFRQQRQSNCISTLSQRESLNFDARSKPFVTDQKLEFVRFQTNTVSEVGSFQSKIEVQSMNEHEWHIYLCLIEVAASVSDIQLPPRSLSTDFPGSDSCFTIPIVSSLPAESVA